MSQDGRYVALAVLATMLKDVELMRFLIGWREGVSHEAIHT